MILLTKIDYKPNEYISDSYKFCTYLSFKMASKIDNSRISLISGNV